jgi:predicted TIM-barrel fold metal-dependent hydrolase
MYTDTAQPHALGMKFTIDYYGVDHVMFGDDYPCWNPEAALEIFEQIRLSKEDQRKVLYDNARLVLNLKDPVPAKRAATV